LFLVGKTRAYLGRAPHGNKYEGKLLSCLHIFDLDKKSAWSNTLAHHYTPSPLNLTIKINVKTLIFFATGSPQKIRYNIVNGKSIYPRQLFENKDRLFVFHSGRLLPCRNILDTARKACLGQTIKYFPGKKGFIASTPEAGSSSEVVERDPGTDGEILQRTVLGSEL
jgi:hypothetical protein